MTLISLSQLIILEEREITTIAAKHNDQNPANFSYCDLSSTTVLEGLDMSGANFQGADCFDMSLAYTNVTRCNFTDAVNLYSVDFAHATMDQATAETIRILGGHLPSTITIVD